jgi:hypothetical protein
MTWEEHEKEYGIVLSDIPKDIQIYDTLSITQFGGGYSGASKRCDHLTYEYSDMLSFHPIRVGDFWHCICNYDLYDPQKDGHQYQPWVLERLIKTEIQ